MWRMTLRLSLLLLLGGLSGTATSPSKRKIPCKTIQNASSCYWTHGRLTYGNGTPAVRLWKIGTHRVLGIYSGPSVDRRHSMDNEGPALPANLAMPFGSAIFADFEVCPLEAEKRGAMQAACIETAKNIFEEK